MVPADDTRPRSPENGSGSEAEAKSVVGLRYPSTQRSAGEGSAGARRMTTTPPFTALPSKHFVLAQTRTWLPKNKSRLRSSASVLVKMESLKIIDTTPPGLVSC